MMNSKPDSSDSLGLPGVGTSIPGATGADASQMDLELFDIFQAASNFDLPMGGLQGVQNESANHFAFSSLAGNADPLPLQAAPATRVSPPPIAALPAASSSSVAHNMGSGSYDYREPSMIRADMNSPGMGSTGTGVGHMGFMQGAVGGAPVGSLEDSTFGDDEVYDADAYDGDDVSMASSSIRAQRAKVERGTGSKGNRKSPGRGKKKKEEEQQYVSTKKQMEQTDDLNEKEKLRSRLMRKAELARHSRRRKKAYVTDLENKVKMLGAKLEEVQRNAAKQKASAHVANLTRVEKERREQQVGIRERLSTLVKKELDSGGQKELARLLKQFVMNSRERQANVDFYLDRVEDCLTPGLQAKFALWGLDQNEEFYTQPGLWDSLMKKEVGVTAEQMKHLLLQRKAIREERLALAHCQAMIRDLRTRARTHLTRLNGQMDRLQVALTPLQIAKFYVWVEENEWCMKMLEGVWNAVPT